MHSQLDQARHCFAFEQDEDGVSKLEQTQDDLLDVSKLLMIDEEGLDDAQREDLGLPPRIRAGEDGEFKVILTDEQREEQNLLREMEAQNLFFEGKSGSGGSKQPADQACCCLM